jgi:hypothetical protein
MSVFSRKVRGKKMDIYWEETKNPGHPVGVFAVFG